MSLVTRKFTSTKIQNGIKNKVSEWNQISQMKVRSIQTNQDEGF